jgi:branched-chain amino acid transport system permease protein
VTQLSQYVLDGLAIGAVYVLVALGFTLVFGVMGIMNVAHADLYMLAVFVMLWVGKDAGAGVGVGAVTGVVAAGAIGWVMFALVLKRIDKAQPLALFVATLGISYFLENLVATLVSYRTRPVPALFKSSFYELGGLRGSSGQALLLAVTLAISTGLALWLRRSTTGKLMRAVAESPPLSEAVGIPTSAIMALAVVIASLVAGLGGVLVSNTTLAIDPFVANNLALKMFAVAVVAGIGSVGGATIVGLALGVVEALAVGYWGSQWQNVVGLVAMVLVLLVRPQGLFGTYARVG